MSREPTGAALPPEGAEAVAARRADAASTGGTYAFRPAARRAVAVLALAALTAVGARIAVPLPGVPVPFTFQVVAVLLAGVLLGPGLGAASQVVYLGAGVAGLPVFSAGGGVAYLLGPTGGYLLAFPVAAALAGALARRGRLVPTVVGCALGVAAIHAGGASWLAITAGPEVAAAALRPFLLGDILKIALVVLVGSRLGGAARRLLG